MWGAVAPHHNEVSMMIRRFLNRIKKHVGIRKEGLTPRGVWDPRERKPKYSLEKVWRTAVLTLCMMMRSVRSATEYGREHKGGLFCGIGRSALSEVMAGLSFEEVRTVLRRQVHAEQRRKSLKPVGLPIGVVAVDGRTNWTGDEKVNEFCQKSHYNDEWKSPYWSFRVVRAVLVSSAARVCIDELPIPADTNDMGVFSSFFHGLIEEYGRSNLFEVVTADAGFCSEGNAGLVNEKGYGYVFALKENQPDLFSEATALLLPMAESSIPEASSAWEREKGFAVQRRLWRTTEMAGWLDWPHLRQVWMVRKVKRHKDGREEIIEDRFFVTNLPVNRLKPQEILELVRRHWGIENNCFWTLDTQWEEDSGLWTRKGNGLPVCSLLRMIAYNIVALLRSVHLKSDSFRRRAWKTLAGWFRDYCSVASLSPKLIPSLI